MGYLFRWILFVFLRWSVSLRYRLHVVGLEHIRKDRGILLLANHVSILDPVVVVLATWRKLKPRPVVTKRYFDAPLLKTIFSSIRAIPAPDFFVGKNWAKLEALEETFSEIVKALKGGDNVLFYPAGRLKVQAEERVEGTSGIRRLLEREPNLSVVMVRTTGLWGSSFSTAPHGRSPDLLKQTLFILKSLCASLLFFMPRRDVTIEFEELFPQNLNQWFNARHPEGEPLALLPYTPFSKESPFQRCESIPRLEGERDPLVDEVIGLIGREGVLPTTHLAFDLNMDSLEVTELFTALQARFDLVDLYTSELATPLHIAAMIRGQWHSRRHLDRLEKYDKQINNVRGVLFDPHRGWQSKKAIAKRVASYSAMFSLDQREEIPLLLPAGLDAYAAFLAAKSVGKRARFLRAQDVPHSQVYTTNDMVYYGNDLSPHDALILLKGGAKGRSKPYRGRPLINALYYDDPQKSLEAADEALHLKRPVVFVCSLTPNARWAYRTWSLLKEGELLLGDSLKGSWDRICDSTTS